MSEFPLVDASAEAIRGGKSRLMPDLSQEELRIIREALEGLPHPVTYRHPMCRCVGWVNKSEKKEDAE